MNYGMGDEMNYGMGDGLGFKIKMPKIKIKVPKIVKQVAKIATLPVRAVAASAVSVVSPKVAAGLAPDVAKKKVWESIGKVGRVGAIVTAGVIAAPAAGGLLAKAGLSKAGLADLAKKMLAKKANQESMPSYEELPQEDASLVSKEEYDKLVSAAKDIPAADLTAAVPMNLRDAVAEKANDPMVLLKQYAPYIAGGFVLLFILPRMFGGGQPVIIRSNPYRRRSRR